MRNKTYVSRRDFLQVSSSAAATTLLRLSAPALTAMTAAACSAKQNAAEFLVLASGEAADFAAIAARIIPTTATPGATEAGVIHFIDMAFADAMSADLGDARRGLAEFTAALADAGHRGQFSQLSEDEQDAFLRTQESGDFFGMLRGMTIFGFFAMSSYGGNQNNIGWELIGFDGHHGAWTYPFGHYDAEHARESSHGE